MKCVLVLAILVAVAVSEHCKDRSDCVRHDVTHCGGQFNVACDQGECHCTRGPNNVTCTQRSDCTCKNHQGHCIDGFCHCHKDDNHQ